MLSRLRLFAASAANAALIAAFGGTAHARLPSCTSYDACGDAGDVCVGLDGGWEGGAFCSAPPIVLDAAVEAGTVVICGPGNGAESEGECLSPTKCVAEIGAYACPSGTVCCRQTECYGPGHGCADSSECCNGAVCAGPAGQEGVPECGGNDLGGTDDGSGDAGNTPPTQAATDAGEKGSSSGGCAVAGFDGGDVSSLWAAGVAVAAVGRRRRRRA